tara:strand:- start:4625 stop:5047 length:423 start_codon:yes stop_codon:yes gene_type:complete
MGNHIKWILFATGWHSIRAVGSSIMLILSYLGSTRGAPDEWIVTLIGDFIIGIGAVILTSKIYKRPTNILWGILLSWNVLGLFDLIGAIVLTSIVPYEPFPEIGLNTLGFRLVFSFNSIIQISSIYLLFTSELIKYFKIK